MNGPEFSRSLAALTPKIEKLRGVGMKESMIAEIISRYTAKQRSSEQQMVTYGDPFLEMLRGWDLSSVKVGPVSFRESVRNSGGELEVGFVDDDPLVFVHASKSYVIKDHEAPTRVMCAAAQGGDGLMGALLTAAEYYSKTVVDELDIFDERVGLATKARCLSMLGGEKFEGFATALVGY